MNYRQRGDPLSTDAALGAGDAGLSLHEAASGVGRGGEDRAGGAGCGTSRPSAEGAFGAKPNCGGHAVLSFLGRAFVSGGNCLTSGDIVYDLCGATHLRYRDVVCPEGVEEGFG